MIAIIGAIAFSVVIVLSILIIFGMPLGELTMGGQYKVFPKRLRIILVTQLILQIFFVIVKCNYEFCIKEQERKVYYDTTFGCCSGMFLDNCTVISRDKNLNFTHRKNKC